MPDLKFDWLDALPDMRVIGVPGVPGVQAQKTATFTGTPESVAGCSKVFHHTSEHLATSAGVPLKPAENRHGTPGTPGTPNFDDGGDAVTVSGHGLERLRARSAPMGVTIGQWMIVVGDALRLRDDGWAEKALGLRWSVSDLYGVRGLAAWLDGRRVTLLDADGANAGPWCRGFLGPDAGRYRRAQRAPAAKLLWEV